MSVVMEILTVKLLGLWTPLMEGGIRRSQTTLTLHLTRGSIKIVIIATKNQFSFPSHLLIYQVQDLILAQNFLKFCFPSGAAINRCVSIKPLLLFVI